MPKTRLTVRIEGAAELSRAFDRLPAEGRREIDEKKNELAERLAEIIRAAGRRDGPQTSRALGGPANTVRAAKGATPAVTVGPHPLLFATEFGMNRRSGWYAAPRFLGSPRRQFRPHNGNVGYWFFPTFRRQGPVIDAAWNQALDAIIRAWG